MPDRDEIVEKARRLLDVQHFCAGCGHPVVADHDPSMRACLYGSHGDFPCNCDSPSHDGPELARTVIEMAEERKELLRLSPSGGLAERVQQLKAQLTEARRLIVHTKKADVRTPQWYDDADLFLKETERG